MKDRILQAPVCHQSSSFGYLGGIVQYQDVDKKIRKCKKCNVIKPFNEFIVNKGCNYDIEWVCKKCSSEIRKERMSGKKQIKAKKDREYRNLNKEKLSLSSKKYREENVEKVRMQKREYYLKNKEKINLKCRNYYNINKTKMMEVNKKYIENNKDYVKNWHTVHARYKRKTDLNYKIKGVLRSRIRAALNCQNAKKALKTANLVGCSLDYLKKHIESQFTEGMNWNELGMFGIHIDHIVPCASFDLTDIEQQKECFHYSNLQPLWAKDNLSKGAKLDW